VPYIISYSGNLFTLRFLSRALLFRESFYSSPSSAGGDRAAVHRPGVPWTVNVSVTVTVTVIVTVTATDAVTGAEPVATSEIVTVTMEARWLDCRSAEAAQSGGTETVARIHRATTKVKSTFFNSVNAKTPVHHSPTNDFSASSA
jgi:hypothetical protein